jgi:dethiobiotin synthetase
VRGFFITGTDTNVGKTVVTAALARALRARDEKVTVFKPVQTGALVDDAAGDAALLGAECVYGFAAPLAPIVAGKLEGKTVEMEQILRRLDRLASSSGTLLVEGVGGFLVPLADNLTVADLARSIGLPLVIVARSTLGTMNHTLLTIEAARSRDLTIAGVVLNGPTDESTAENADVIARFGHVKVVAQVPQLDDPAAAEEHLGELAALA